MSIVCKRSLAVAALVLLAAALAGPSAASAETASDRALWSVGCDFGLAWDMMYDVKAVEYDPSEVTWPDLPFGLIPSVGGCSSALLPAMGDWRYDWRNGPASVTIESLMEPQPELPFVCGTILLNRPGSLPPAKEKLIVAKASGDGSSAEKAIVIEAETEDAGVAKEYEYIEKTYGKRGEAWRLITQDLYSIKGRDYDMLAIRLKDGTRREIWFDITSFFGVEIRKALEKSPPPEPAKPGR